jgi:hypothetical protein
MTQNKVKKDYLSFDEQVQRSGGFIIGFQEGFQKALSLLGDKKFSEEDVISMIEKSRKTGLTAEYIILTKQQTEWEVEIITKPYTEVSEGFKLESKREPKLDEDGNLTLKRI